MIDLGKIKKIQKDKLVEEVVEEVLVENKLLKNIPNIDRFRETEEIQEDKLVEKVVEEVVDENKLLKDIPDNKSIGTHYQATSPIYSIRIPYRIQIDDWKLDVIGLIDTGCSNTILNEKLVSPTYIKHLSPSHQYKEEQMDGKLFTYTKQLEPVKLVSLKMRAPSLIIYTLKVILV